MDAHLRQQFDVLLAMAVDRYAERLEQHNEGTERALVALRDAPDAPAVALDAFVDAVFRDALLDTADGALYVLGALASRPLPAGEATMAGGGRVGAHVQALARATFAALLRDRTLEELERRQQYGAHLMAQHG